MKKIIAMIMASGTSSRTGSINKLRLDLGGETVIQKTVKAFNRDWIHEVVVVCRDQAIREELRNFSVRFVEGGESRAESVYRGLLSLEEDAMVLIHDGARPFVDEKTLERVHQACLKEENFVVCVPAIDTIKIVKDQLVLETPDRSMCYYAQTPQGGPVATLLRGYEKVRQEAFRVTDDASVLEYLGEEVVVLEGHYANKKITTKEDVAYYENRTRD